jgi:ElaB/YqjD/DUF883 family membrane-anchored ribosome-binding protein
MVEETVKLLETLTTKIDELATAIKEEKVLTKEEVEETSKEEKVLEKLTTKIDDLTTVIKDKKVFAEEKIKENPLAYVIGAFAGGIFVGLLIRMGMQGTEGRK